MQIVPQSELLPQWARQTTVFRQNQDVANPTTPKKAHGTHTRGAAIWTAIVTGISVSICRCRTPCWHWKVNHTMPTSVVVPARSLWRYPPPQHSNCSTISNPCSLPFHLWSIVAIHLPCFIFIGEPCRFLCLSFFYKRWYDLPVYAQRLTNFGTESQAIAECQGRSCGRDRCRPCWLIYSTPACAERHKGHFVRV